MNDYRFVSKLIKMHEQVLPLTMNRGCIRVTCKGTAHKSTYFRGRNGVCFIIMYKKINDSLLLYKTSVRRFRVKRKKFKANRYLNLTKG